MKRFFFCFFVLVLLSGTVVDNFFDCTITFHKYFDFYIIDIDIDILHFTLFYIVVIKSHLRVVGLFFRLLKSF